MNIDLTLLRSDPETVIHNRELPDIAKRSFDELNSYGFMYFLGLRYDLLSNFHRHTEYRLIEAENQLGSVISAELLEDVETSLDYLAPMFKVYDDSHYETYLLKEKYSIKSTRVSSSEYNIPFLAIGRLKKSVIEMKRDLPIILRAHTHVVNGMDASFLNDFFKYSFDLRDAVEREDYEQAVKLRDSIEDLLPS